MINPLALPFGGCAACVAVGIYALLKRELPPITRDGEGRLVGPEVSERAAIRIGIACIVIGLSFIVLIVREKLG
jgi:hypothetical protein